VTRYCPTGLSRDIELILQVLASRREDRGGSLAVGLTTMLAQGLTTMLAQVKLARGSLLRGDVDLTKGVPLAVATQ